MNCAEWQEQIALFAGGDLPEKDAAAVEVHLAQCAECTTFERELSSARADLLLLRPVDDADLARVRSNVMGQLARRRRSVIPMLLPFAAAIAMLLFGWTMWKPNIMPPPANVATIQPPSSPANVSRIAPVARKATKPRVARHKAPAKEETSTVVTLFTDDPDVVIVWITD